MVKYKCKKSSMDFSLCCSVFILTCNWCSAFFTPLSNSRGKPSLFGFFGSGIDYGLIVTYIFK